VYKRQGKGLYTPVHIVESAILSARRLLEKEAAGV